MGGFPTTTPLSQSVPTSGVRDSSGPPRGALTAEIVTGRRLPFCVFSTYLLCPRIPRFPSRKGFVCFGCLRFGKYSRAPNLLQSWCLVLVLHSSFLFSLFLPRETLFFNLTPSLFAGHLPDPPLGSFKGLSSPAPTTSRLGPRWWVRSFPCLPSLLHSCP